MQERRLLPNDWVKKLKAAQIKSEELRNQFPGNHTEETVKKLKKQIQERGEDFIYKDANEVFQTLIEKTEEGKQKSFLGRYKSQLVYDWQILLRIYESDNLYLAEYGKIIQQVHGFDTPSMKKQLQSMSRQINESGQKISDFKRGIVEQEKKFHSECSKLGIMPTVQTQDLETQIFGLVEHLVPKFQHIESLIKDKTIQQVIEYYQEFNKNLELKAEVLPFLKHFSQFGDENLSVYEFKKRNPGQVVPPELLLREEHKYDLYKRFEQIINGTTADGGVQEIDIAESGTIDIDWSQIDENLIESEDKTVNNSWTMIEDSEGKVGKEVSIKEDLSKFNEEETILYNQESRQTLINDLEECEYFMRQRLAELSSKDQATYSMYIESQQRKEILKQCDQVEFLQKAIKHIEKIHNELNNKDTLQLILIRQKPKVAVQRLVQKLQSPLKLKEKYEQQIISMEKKLKEMQKELDPLKKSIEENEKLIKELSAVIAKELSVKLKATVKVVLKYSIEKGGNQTKRLSIAIDHMRRISYKSMTQKIKTEPSSSAKQRGNFDKQNQFETPLIKENNHFDPIYEEGCYNVNLRIKNNNNRSNVSARVQQRQFSPNTSQVQEPEGRTLTERFNVMQTNPSSLFFSMKKMNDKQLIYEASNRSTNVYTHKGKYDMVSNHECEYSDSDGCSLLEVDFEEKKTGFYTNRDFKFKSPFQNDTKVFDLYSPKLGFGKKAAMKSNQHSIRLDKSLDGAIETVALQVSQKELLMKQKRNLRVDIAFLKQEHEKLKKEGQLVEESIGKTVKVQREKECQNFQLNDEIKKMRKKISHYSTVMDDLKIQEADKNKYKQKIEFQFKKFQNELAVDIKILEEEQDHINNLAEKYCAKDIEIQDFRKKNQYAGRLENERINLLKEKEKVLESIIHEERLTKKHGDKVQDSLLGKRVMHLVKGLKHSR